MQEMRVIMSVNRDALNKTAQRVKNQAEQNGRKITHEEAKKIVKYHLNRADNKRKRG